MEFPPYLTRCTDRGALGNLGEENLRKQRVETCLMDHEWSLPSGLTVNSLYMYLFPYYFSHQSSYMRGHVDPRMRVLPV